jgi:AI-2 transport protein TqsA
MMPKVADSGLLRYLLAIALIFVIVIGLKMTGYLVTIVVVSLVITMLAIPAMTRLRKRGLPDIVSVSLLTGLAVVLIVILVALTVFSFAVLVRDLPLYQVELNQRIAGITMFLDSYGIGGASLTPPSVDLQSLLGMVTSSVIGLSDLVLYLFFIAVTTFFMLLEYPQIEDRARRLLGESSRFQQVSRMSTYMVRFVVVRTETNLVHGVLFGGALFVMGVHAALLWGILTFVLAYIPYIGLIIAAIPAIFFAWLQFGTWGAVAVIALVCVLNLVVENPVFSYFAARKFEIPALVVIFSVIFWGWVLGIAGMVFAVPLTLMVLIIFQCSDDLVWVNRLLGVDRILETGEEGTGPEA